MQDANRSVQGWRQLLGAQIRDAREKAGMTQKALATAAGLKSRNIIGRYEAGSDAPSVAILGTIALQLHMPEIHINGHRFTVTRRIEVARTQPEQLQLDFEREFVYQGATVKISPRKTSITIITSAPLIAANE